MAMRIAALNASCAARSWDYASLLPGYALTVFCRIGRAVRAASAPAISKGEPRPLLRLIYFVSCALSDEAEKRTTRQHFNAMEG